MSNNKIAIAWRRDKDNEFCHNVCRIVELAGGEPVFLEQVKSNDIVYDGYEISNKCVDKNYIVLQEYADAIKKNSYYNSNVKDVIKDFKAIIFTGGADFSPSMYHISAKWSGIKEDKKYEPERDISDILLMKYCIDNDIHVLGICRGCQLMSIAKKGIIIEDLNYYFKNKGLKYNYMHRKKREFENQYRDYLPHDVNILNKNSLLYKIYNREVIKNVPSWHHQAMKEVGEDGIAVSGITETLGENIIEALEIENMTFALGLQFHPEAAVIKRLKNEYNKDMFMCVEDALLPFMALINSIK